MKTIVKTAVILSLTLMLFALCTVSAETDLFTYSVEDGVATIQTCDPSAIGSIEIPVTIDGYPVRAIAPNAFSECYYIETVSVPDSIEEIGPYAFAGCGLTGVTLPETLLSIGDSAFYDCYNLFEINLPQNLISIGNNAFAYSRLENIEIPSSVQTIGAYAFSYTNLFEVYMQNGLKEIGESAFQGCDLTTVVIPDSVTTIGFASFAECYNLQSMTLPFVGVSATGNGGLAYLFAIDIDDFYKYPYLSEITLSDTCTELGEDAFCNLSSLVNLKLSKNLITIGSHAFAGCSFTSITLPETLMFIGDGAFWGCYNLHEITLPQGLKSIGYSAFEHSGIEHINIPSSVEYIRISAFANSQLQEAILQNGIKEIEDYAFLGCENLTNVVIPDSVTKIGFASFAECFNLQSMTLPFVGKSATENGSLTYLFAIDTDDFNQYPYLSEITLSDTCTELGDDTFYNLSSLVNLKLSKNLKTIGTCALGGCSFTSINLPDTLITIGNGAFAGCSNLCDITLPQKLSSIGGHAFENTGIKTIIIPSSVQTIGEFAFSYSNLQEAILQNGVKVIEKFAFLGCKNLTNVVIPDSVTTIGFASFCECNNLQSMTLPFVGESATENRRLAYLFALNTDDFNQYPYLSEITLSDKCTDIGEFAFYNLSSLEKITLPKNLTSIGYCAFSGCNLLEAYLPDTLITIGDGAFAGCRNLSGIILPQQLETIGEYSFTQTNIDYISIPESVKSIGEGAFYSVPLTYVTICSDARIGTNAFYDCPSLKYAIFTGNAPLFFGDDVFGGADADFVMYYYINNDSDWYSPEQYGYPIKAVTKITYDANCGDEVVNMPEDLPFAVIGTPFVPSQTKPQRKGYFFKGWSNDPYGAVLDGSIETTEDFKYLYAIWEPTVLGDVNHDGAITAFDAVLILRIIAGLDVAEDNTLSYCDLNGDGAITAFDAVMILRKVAGLSSAIVYNFDNNEIGKFSLGNCIGKAVVSDGFMIGIPATKDNGTYDPIVGIPIDSIDLNIHKVIRIGMKWNSPANIIGVKPNLFFVTEESLNWAYDKCIYATAAYESNSSDTVEEFVFICDSNELWTGNLNGLRFDPYNAPGEFQIDYIIIEEF